MSDGVQEAKERIIARLNFMNGNGIKIVERDNLPQALMELYDGLILGGLTMDMLDFLSTRGVIQLIDEQAAAKSIESLKAGG